MESNPNPYTSPSANLFGSTTQTTGDSVSAEAISQLQRTKPWVRFISVLMWILMAFVMLAALGMGAVAMLGGEMAKASGMNASMMAGMAVGYTLLAFFYIYPAVKMWQYASSIQRLMNSRTAADLVTALSHQRAMWKYVGIIAIVIILLYIAIFAVAISVGVAGAMKGMNPAAP